MNKKTFVMKQSRQSHECTLHSSRRLGKKFPIPDECFLALTLLNNEFSCLIPGFCGLQENSSRGNAVQDDLTGAGGLMQPDENKIFFLVPKNKKNELNYQNQIRKSVPKSFLCLCSDTTWRDTEHSDGAPWSVHAVRCLLFMHYVHVQYKWFGDRKRVLSRTNQPNMENERKRK